MQECERLSLSHINSQLKKSRGQQPGNLTAPARANPLAGAFTIFSPYHWTVTFNHYLPRPTAHSETVVLRTCTKQFPITLIHSYLAPVLNTTELLTKFPHLILPILWRQRYLSAPALNAHDSASHRRTDLVDAVYMRPLIDNRISREVVHP